MFLQTIGMLDVYVATLHFFYVVTTLCLRSGLVIWLGLEKMVYATNYTEIPLTS